MQNYMKSVISVGQYRIPQFGRMSSPEGLLDRIGEYAVLIFVFPGLDRFPEDILKGFRRFCKGNGFDYRIVDSIDDCNVRCGQAYIFMQDEDMMEMFERLQLLGLAAGKDIGMLSFNDSPLKRVVLDGVTTISSGLPDIYMRSSL